MPVPFNPFIVGTSVREPSLFINRADELRLVLGGLANPFTPSSFAIHGTRRIGKSSFLHRLSRPQRDDPAPPPGTRQWRFTLVDCQSLSPFSPDRFWAFALRALADGLGEAQKAEQAEALRLVQYGKFDDPYALTRLFDRLTEEGLTTVLLLDEFESAARSGHPGIPDFLDLLRSLVSGGMGALAYVVASGESLVRLLPRANTPGSPFANIFSLELQLKPFVRADVEQLINVYLQSAGLAPQVFGPEERDAVWKASEGMPERAQLASKLIFDRLLAEGRTG